MLVILAGVGSFNGIFYVGARARRALRGAAGGPPRGRGRRRWRRSWSSRYWSSGRRGSSAMSEVKEVGLGLEEPVERRGGFRSEAAALGRPGRPGRARRRARAAPAGDIRLVLHARPDSCFRLCRRLERFRTHIDIGAVQHRSRRVHGHRGLRRRDTLGLAALVAVDHHPSGRRRGDHRRRRYSPFRSRVCGPCTTRWGRSFLGYVIMNLITAGGKTTGMSTGLGRSEAPVQLPHVTTTIWASGLMIVSLACMRRFEFSRIGVRMKAVAQSHQVAASVGIGERRNRILAVAFGSFFAGLLGAFYCSLSRSRLTEQLRSGGHALDHHVRARRWAQQLLGPGSGRADPADHSRVLLPQSEGRSAIRHGRHPAPHRLH